MKNHILVLALGSAMALSACGGGGGGGGSTTPPPVTTTPPPVSTQSSITAANATSAASNAYAATTSVGTSSDTLTAILTGVSVSRVNINTVAPVLNLVKLAYSGKQLLVGVTNVQNCAVSGTLTLDATLGNPSANTFSNGDSMTVTATNCVNDATNNESVNGTLSIKFSGVSGSIPSKVFGVTMDTTFTDFNITSGTTKVGVKGDMKIVLNQTSAGMNNIALSGSSLQTTEQQGSAAVVNRTITGYTVTGKNESGVSTSAADFGLSGTSPKLGTFTYTVKNLAPFVINAGAAVPSSGSLIVTGNASSVTATVVANGVRVDFSAAGNGTITSTETVAWNAFLSSI